MIIIQEVCKFLEHTPLLVQAKVTIINPQMTKIVQSIVMQDATPQLYQDKTKPTSQQLRSN